MHVTIRSVDVANDGSKGNSREVQGNAKISCYKTHLGKNYARFTTKSTETHGTGERGGRDENLRVIEKDADVYISEEELSALLNCLIESDLPGVLSYESALKLSQKLISYALEQ